MNRFFKFISLAIILKGAYGASHQAIADKYSKYYKTDVVIDMKNKIDCGPETKRYKTLGCTHWYVYPDDKIIPAKIEISNSKANLKEFEYTMLHEIGHYQYLLKTEKEADNYADQIIAIRSKDK